MGTLRDPNVKLLLLDIEGTTTPVDFVTKVLFPYARRHVEPFLREHWNHAEVRADVEGLKAEHAQDLGRGLDPPPLQSSESPQPVFRYVHWLMEQDRKSTSLKSLQGKIWEAGYRSGELHSEVYDDVPRAFERWHRQGKAIAIFSSGSVLAQKLLFSSTGAGDLTGFIRAYFDTTIGAKREPDSYRRIASALGVEADEVLFISDVAAELDAARSTGMRTSLAVRPGSSQPESPAHPVIQSFDEV